MAFRDPNNTTDEAWVGAMITADHIEDTRTNRMIGQAQLGIPANERKK